MGKWRALPILTQGTICLVPPTHPFIPDERKHRMRRAVTARIHTEGRSRPISIRESKDTSFRPGPAIKLVPEALAARGSIPKPAHGPKTRMNRCAPFALPSSKPLTKERDKNRVQGVSLVETRILLKRIRIFLRSRCAFSAAREWE